MSIAYIFLVGSALAFLFIVAIYAIHNRTVTGAKAYILQIVCVTIWSIGSLLEMLSQSEHQMLLWRNIQQIGVFLIPVACVYFAVDYAQYNNLKKYIPLLLIVSVSAILLIFSDEKTHLMRTGYLISYSPFFGKALSVHQTLLGKLLVTYNYLLALISLVILFIFSRQVSRALRRQVWFILIATGLVFVLGFLKSAFLEGTSINIPIVIIYLPGSIILFYNLFQNNLFRVSPIAREKVFDVVEMGILVTDASGMIADINPFAAHMLHPTFEITEHIGGKPVDTVFASFPDWLNQIKQNTVGEVELHLLQPREHYIQIRVYPLLSGKDVYVGSVSIMSDTTADRLQEFALKAKAETDSLTGLLNRESFQEAFAAQFRQCTRTGSFFSVLMMDLDKFKNINDTYGHDTGDRVLVAFAELLKAALRHEDSVARLGGDEFVALLPGIAKREATEIANRILRSAKAEKVSCGSESGIPLVVSIGICDNVCAASEDAILKAADQAMYLAKNSSGNCCVEWSL